MNDLDLSLLEQGTAWIAAYLALRVAQTDGSDLDALLSVETVERARFEQELARMLKVEPAGNAWFTRLALTRTELVALMTLAAVEVDDTAAAALQRLSPAGATTRALRRLVYADGLQRLAFVELAPTGTMRRLGLVQVQRNATGDEIWIIGQRCLALLHGEHSVGREISSLLREACRSSALVLGPDVRRELPEACRAERNCVVLSGAPATGRRSAMMELAECAGARPLAIASERLSRSSDVLADELRMIARECRLLGRVPLLCNIDALVDDKDTTRLDLVGSELVPLIDGPVLVTCGVNRPRLDWGRPVIVVEMGQPTTAQRAQLWHQALGQGTQEDADLLATRYPLAPALIVRAAEAAKARAHGRKLAPDDIYAGIRAVLDDRLGQFAKRVTVTQTWDDLVLPEEQVDAIVELMARIRERRRVYEEWGFAAKVGKGLGVSALFSGPPGTGKTMVAALIARDLGLELYQVDVSKLVSKYIGETEKHLAALFDAAEAGHAVLLFDEADALFGKRTDVKSSNDRYANLETNYLLQRLENFTGICLLTTNHESHIDPAFQRRLSLHLRFDLPDGEQRAALWRAMLPDAAPVASTVDLEGLGRKYAMSGGYIRNAALRAAFLAANDGTPISAQHLERAARLEYEGMGKIAST